ncbi:MAG: propanol-preferring alcohol dehydrogenase [Acidimicrobiales bacterium]|jgi:propanol-preferring alcohol dehydrogenase
MRAVLATAANEPLTFVQDYAEPLVRGDGELIEVTACGVCHSDLHVVEGVFPSPLPMVLGHEVTGVHAELGPVMVYAPWGCRSCVQCDRGLEMMCADATEAGLFTNGGYADRMLVKHRRYLAPLDGLDPIASAPLACGGLTAWRAVQHSLQDVRAQGHNARATVIGAGGLGQYALSYLRLLTDAHVTAVDIAADKLDAAITLGAHEAVHADDLGDAGPADVVIDFIGNEPTLINAANHVARQGLVIVVGLGMGRIPFGFGAVPHEARFMSSVWGSRAELDDLLACVRREPSLVRDVDVLPLSAAQDAHDRLRAGQTRGRIVLTTS